MDNAAIERAKAQFGKLLEDQMRRIEKVLAAPDWIDYSKVETLRIGILAGDGIGPFIAGEARRILELLLSDEVRSGKIVINDIEGLTIENRSAHGKTIPDDVLEEIRKYHVTLKGPTYTPRVGDPWPNLESCNVAMRKELDLFANLRPVRIPTQGIDWAFFRENTEDLYAGIEFEQGQPATRELADYINRVSPDRRIKSGNDETGISIKPISVSGTERIVRFAFEYARANGRKKVTSVHKANIMKHTDGLFLRVSRKVAEDFPEVEFEDRIVDNMCMQLVQKPELYDVLVLPNLYGDILSDLAAGLVGGLGVAPGANIGPEGAVFEATHGSAPKYKGQNKVNPTALVLSGMLMLRHLEEPAAADRLERAVAAVIAEGKDVTYDMKPSRDDPSAVGTQEMAEAICRKIA